MLFFFQKKKQKALFCFAEGSLTQTSAKPTQGVWGLAPKEVAQTHKYSASRIGLRILVDIDDG
jgi:hypothetical protein